MGNLFNSKMVGKQKKSQPKSKVKANSATQTVHLHPVLKSVVFKKKSTRAIRHIKALGQKHFYLNDARVDTKLNKHIWQRGTCNPPRRIRVKFEKKTNDNEDAKEK